MRYVRELTDSELVTLEFAYKNHVSARVRTRAHIIILSSKGYPLQAIADICEITRQTVSTVINRWEESGIIGLYDRPRPGKPRSLTSDDEDFIHDLSEQESRSVNKMAPRRFEWNSGKNLPVSSTLDADVIIKDHIRIKRRGAGYEWQRYHQIGPWARRPSGDNRTNT